MNYRLTNLPEHHAQCFDLATIRRIDNYALTELALPLMENAGKAAAQLLIEQLPHAEKIAVFAGSGNNGGDASICACHLIKAGKEVQFFFTTPPKRKEALCAWEGLLKISNSAPNNLDSLPEMETFDCVVDGLLGSGLQDNITKKMYEIIEHINSTNLPCLSLDVPSGLNASTGKAQSIAIKSKFTLTFVGLKKGLFCNDGRDVCGEIFFNPLGIPKHVYSKFEPEIQLATRLPFLPRNHNSHKNCYGRVNIIGGQPSMSGAVIMAAEAAMRCGVGAVIVTTHENHASFLSTALPEAMFDVALCSQANIRLVGPGLGKSNWSKNLFKISIKESIEKNHPILVDADGLRLLANNHLHYDKWVLTPHPGEAASLLDTDISSIEADRVQSAKKIALKYGGVVVLKGSATVIATETDCSICPFGNPAMASAGMGDVLSGIIAALIGQNTTLYNAAQQGVAIHAYTGDKLLYKKGWGLQATDIVEALFING